MVTRHGARHQFAKSIRLDQVESVEAYGSGARVVMMSGDVIDLKSDDAKLLESGLAYFNAGYKSVLDN
jgi:hypothetical protein